MSNFHNLPMISYMIFFFPRVDKIKNQILEILNLDIKQVYCFTYGVESQEQD